MHWASSRGKIGGAADEAKQAGRMIAQVEVLNGFSIIELKLNRANGALNKCKNQSELRPVTVKIRE